MCGQVIHLLNQKLTVSHTHTCISIVLKKTSVRTLLNQKLAVSHIHTYQYCFGDDKCIGFALSEVDCITHTRAYQYCMYIIVQIEHVRTIIGIIAIFTQYQLSLYFRVSSVTILISRQLMWKHWSHGSHYTLVSPVSEFSLVIYYVWSQATFSTGHRTNTNKTQPTQQRTLQKLATWTWLKDMCSQSKQYRVL